MFKFDLNVFVHVSVYGKSLANPVASWTGRLALPSTQTARRSIRVVSKERQEAVAYAPKPDSPHTGLVMVGCHLYCGSWPFRSRSGGQQILVSAGQDNSVWQLLYSVSHMLVSCLCLLTLLQRSLRRVVVQLSKMFYQWSCPTSLQTSPRIKPTV